MLLVLPHTLWSCAGSVTGVPRLMRPRGHSRGDPRCQHLGSNILLPALLHLGTPQSSLGTACAGAAPCSKLPGDTCIDTAEGKIRHSEELHFTIYRPGSGLEWDKSPGTPWCCHDQGSSTRISVGILPLPGRTPGLGLGQLCTG